MNDLIENSAQITPEWLTKTLLRNGHLKQGSAAEISTQTFQSFFADFYRIEIKYSDDAAPELPELMILKVSFAINEQVLEMGRAECDDYRKLFAVMPAAPFPRFFAADIDQETGRSQILLDDLSLTHIGGDAKEKISLRQWERGVETLADLHAFWWESAELGTAGQMLSAAGIDDIEKRLENDLPKFFAALDGEITPEIRARYENARAFLPG